MAVSFFDPRRAMVIAQKEFRHIARDPLSSKVMLAFPVLLACFFGFAIDFEVRDVDVLISDGDRTRASRQLVDLLDRSGYFKVRQEPSVIEAHKALGLAKAKAVMIIPPRFQRDMLMGRPVSAQVLLDGADDQAASIVTSYLADLQEAAQRRLAGARRAAAQVRTRYLFNEELTSRWFIIPGLFATILGLFAILLPALAVSREWEDGSMELLLSTPVRPLEIIAGKLLPYFLLCGADAVVIYALARWVFGVPFLGSHLVLAAGTVLFLVACIAHGLLISVMTRAQRLSYTMASQTGNSPNQLLSGFVFPVENMPWLTQWAVALLPSRWYVALLRSTFLRAADFGAVARPLLALAALAALLVAAALYRFKVDLEA
jgi:ABC-2 type transport system permease protein